MRRYLSLVAVTITVALALALGAVACGGDDSPSSSATTAANGGDGTGGGSAATAELGSGGGELCEESRDQLKELFTGGQEELMATVLPSLLDPSKSETARAKLKELATDLRQRNEALLGAAPPEIRDDLETLSSASYAVYDALDEADYDFTKLDLDSLTDVADDPQFVAALDRVNTYYKDRCGIDLDSLGN